MAQWWFQTLKPWQGCHWLRRAIGGFEQIGRRPRSPIPPQSKLTMKESNTLAKFTSEKFDLMQEATLTHDKSPPTKVDRNREGAEPGLVPFCVDLDGTLVRDDTFWLLFMQGVKVAPLTIWRALLALVIGGKAKAKRLLGRSVPIDVSTLLFNEQVLEWIKTARAAGQAVWLVTASDQHMAEQVASYLGLFDRVIGSDGVQNLRGSLKAGRLLAECGPRGFDYVGDNDTDSHVWNAARKVFAVVQNEKQATTLRRRFPDAAIALLPRLMTSASLIGRVLRVKQWSKNLLLLVPLFTAHLLSNGRAWALAGVGQSHFALPVPPSTSATTCWMCPATGSICAKANDPRPVAPSAYQPLLR